MIFYIMRWIRNWKVRDALGFSYHGGFEAGERKIEAGDFRDGERVFFGVAILSVLRDFGAAGIGETEDFGDFVETFADGVVFRGADDFEGVVGRHGENLGVAAGNDEGEDGEFYIIFGIKPVGVNVGLQVVDGVEGFFVEEGEGAGGQSADEEGTQEPGSVGDGDGVDGVEGLIGVF